MNLIRMRQFSLYNFGLVIAAIGMVFFSGCENKEKVALAKAEQCINRSNENNVFNNCMPLLEGQNSEKADMYRCSIYYIKNGFTGNRLAQAFERIKNNPNPAQDPMINAMALMVFPSITEAETAGEYCMRSNVTSMKRFSTMTKMATYMASLSGNFPGGIPADGSLNANDMDTALTNFEANLSSLTPEQLTAVGTTIIEAADGYCGAGSAYASTPICTNLNAAVEADASNQTIIQGLLDALNAP